MSTDRDVASTMRKQYGLISRAQARSAGVTANRINYRLRTGQWDRVDTAVYRSAAVAPSWRGELLRVHLATGGVVSHRAAGVMWEIVEAKRGPIELSVPAGRHTKRVGVVLHETSQFPLADVTPIDGVPCTGLGRTVLDLAAVVSRRRLDHVVDAALRSKRITWPGLHRDLVAHRRRGRSGCGPLRDLLDQRYGDERVPDSSWNRWVAELLADAGLPEPSMEWSVFDTRGFVARVDLAYPHRRIAIELDSVRWHHNVESFQSDRAKRNRLLAAGWNVLAFTWSDYRDRPDELCALVAKAISPGSA